MVFQLCPQGPQHAHCAFGVTNVSEACQYDSAYDSIITAFSVIIENDAADFFLDEKLCHTCLSIAAIFMFAGDTGCIGGDFTGVARKSTH
jgi:hypothetical protein